MRTAEFLRGQLERLFELDGMMALSSELLGVEPGELGGTSAKGTFARAIVNHCETHDELSVLAAALRLSASEQNEPLEALSGEDDQLAPDSEVHTFRVLKLLEKGPLATVYLAERPAPFNGHTEQALLKILHREHTRDRVAVWRLLRAARSLANVRDPGLCGIYDAGTLPDGRVFVATENVHGESLSARLARGGPLSFGELRPIARSVLSGLAALHERGFLHGYLSPEHVLIVKPQPGAREGGGQGYGVLSELAIARLLESDGALPGVLRLVGDPGLMAPEVARSQAPSALSELYAVGGLLYFALCGAPPFAAETPIDQVLANLLEEPEPPSGRAPPGFVSPELDRVILRALSKEPIERYQSARELSAALEALSRASVPPGASPASEEELARASAQLHEDPSDPTRASELEALVAPAGAWQSAIDAFLEAAETSEDPATKKHLYFRTARILADELANREAAERMYRSVLELDPSDAQAHNAIEELHRASGDHNALISALCERLKSETSQEARAAILREVATLYEDPLGQPESALDAWTEALSEEPGDERARRAVERLASDAAQLEKVIATLRDGIGDSSDRPAHALALSVLSAEWYATRLSRPDSALACLNAALRIDPAHEPALEALAELYRSAEAWDELVQLLFQRADVAANPAKKRDFKAEAAIVAQLKLGDLKLAERTLVEVLADDPLHPQATHALEEIYVDAGELEKLLALLERKAKELRGAARAQALCELGELYEDSDQDEALARYQAALEDDDKQLAGYKGLERIYAARGAHGELLTALERQLELLTTPQQRLALLERMGALLDEQLAEPARAAECFERIIEVMPAHEGANSALSRLYRTLHRFDDLAQTYDRHAKGVADPARKVELLMQAARVLMADIGSPERAAFVCERVLAVEPEQPEALALTARIRALAGDTVAAIDALELLADSEQDPQRKADHWVRAGQLLESHDDLDGAIERYRLALDVVPGHAPALSALGRLYDRRGDVHGEADLLLRQVELASEPHERARLLVALGKLRMDKLKDKSLAADAYRRANELDPANRQALLGLGQLALADRRWQDACERLEPLLDHTTELPPEITLEVLVGVGDAFRELDQLAKAERAYLSAKALAPEERLVGERLAELALLRKDYPEACSFIGALLDRGGSTLSTSDRGKLLMKLGDARQQLGELDRAAAAYSTASELRPDWVEPIEALCAVQELQNNSEAVARTLQRRLVLEDDPERRFELLVRIGDSYAQLKERAQAASFFVSALELNANDRNLLSKLMAVYSESKDWQRLIEVLERMAGLVEEPELRAKYLYTAGSIAHGELAKVDVAVDCYQSALGSNPSLQPAFRGLVDCLTKLGDWDNLATTYRTRAERLRNEQAEQNREELVSLWDKLGEIYGERLNRIDRAVEAYEAASELEPEDRSRLERLVELYGKQPSRFADRAIAAHERLLAQNPYRVESYRGLRKLYTQLSRADDAWAVCQALRGMNMAEPEEETFFKRHRVLEPATAKACISEELWQEYLLMPEQDPSLTQMLALIQPAAVEELAQAPEAFGVTADRPADCERDPSVMARMLHYASGVTLVPLPHVYYRARDAGGLSFVFTNPPALGLGQAALRSAPDQAMAFIAGRQLSYFRPGHYMRQLVPTGSGLRGWLLSAIWLANPRFPVPEPMRAQIERNHAALKRTLHAPEQSSLTSLVEKLLHDQPELDMKRWMLALDLAADRLGFVLANSLEAAAAVMRASPAATSLASERDRLKALYTYAVSPRYLALRKAIGITIN